MTKFEGIFDSGWFRAENFPKRSEFWGPLWTSSYLHTQHGLKCSLGPIPHSSCTFRWSPANRSAIRESVVFLNAEGPSCHHGLTIISFFWDPLRHDGHSEKTHFDCGTFFFLAGSMGACQQLEAAWQVLGSPGPDPQPMPSNIQLLAPKNNMFGL